MVPSGPLRERVRISLLGGELAATGLLDIGYVERMISDHQAYRRDYSAPLWTTLMFDAFLRTQGLYRGTLLVLSLERPDERDRRFRQ